MISTLLLPRFEFIIKNSRINMTSLLQIQSISPLDGRYYEKVKELTEYFSEFALIKYRLRVEIEWLIALAGNRKIDSISTFSQTQKGQLRDLYRKFRPQDALAIKAIEKITNHDVKAVEYYINRKLEDLNLEYVNPMVHFACTSEDINNLAYGLMLQNALREIVVPVCQQLLNAIRRNAEKYRKQPMLSRTHGQPASPTTLGKEFFNVSERLQRQLDQIKSQKILGKMNGAVGNFNAHCIGYPDVDWKKFGRNFVESLGLTWNPATTQIEPHDYLAEIFHHFIRWNTIVLDFNRDIWSYIAIGVFKQRIRKGEVGSSTMPHKINPIDFENSEGNLGIANALMEYLAAKLPISRWQRDLSDSTTLRNVGLVFGYSILAYKSTLKGIDKLAIDKKKIENDLQDSWLILGEALQTVMRKHKIPDSYEKLKALTQGKDIDQKTLKNFLYTLDLPKDVIEQLEKLTPSSYLGYATEF